MGKFLDKRISSLSLLTSLAFHACLLLVGHAAIAYSLTMPIGADRSVLLELNPKLSVKSEAPVRGDKTATVDQSISEIKNQELSADAAPRNLGWDDREFKERQSRMDAKIEAIREQIKKIKSAQTNQSGALLKGFELVSAGLESESWKSYLSKLRQQVLEKWYPMILSREGQLDTSEAQLDFFIGSDGRVLSYEIAKLSGTQEFAELCLEAFRRAIGAELKESKSGVKLAGNSLKVSLFFYYQ